MKILVADDDSISLNVLKSSLLKWGYDVEAVKDGKSALDVLTGKQGPKIAILDWMMPEMDGIEVCKRIKKDNPTIFIILLTSAENPDILPTALMAGADDFIAKPFKGPELQARIEVGKRIVQLYETLSSANEKLRQYASEMESLAAERAEQLIHAERLSTLGILTAGVAHEINNPMSFISISVQTLQMYWPIQEKQLRACAESHPDYEKLMLICEEVPEVLNGIRKGTKRISTIINGLKTYARQDVSEQIEYDIHQVMEDSLLLCNNKLKYNVTVEKKYSENIPNLMGDPRKIEQVFVNLFSNAADAMSDLKKGILNIRTEKDEDRVSITILDNGTGMSENTLQKMFTPFFTTKPVGKGTGLGLSISQGIIEAHGGEIIFRNRPECGASFTVILPSCNSKSGP